MYSRMSAEFIASDRFLSTSTWRRFRYEALLRYGRKCRLCGRRPEHNVVLNVSHIVSRRAAPWKALDIENVQILCDECNIGMRNDDADFRYVSKNAVLTNAIVAGLPAPRKRVIVYDVILPKFGVRLFPTGRKSFVANGKIAGKKRTITIGNFPEVDTKVARFSCGVILHQLEFQHKLGENVGWVYRSENNGQDWKTLIGIYNGNVKLDMDKIIANSADFIAMCDKGA